MSEVQAFYEILIDSAIIMGVTMICAASLIFQYWVVWRIFKRTKTAIVAYKEAKQFEHYLNIGYKLSNEAIHMMALANTYEDIMTASGIYNTSQMAVRCGYKHGDRFSDMIVVPTRKNKKGESE